MNKYKFHIIGLVIIVTSILLSVIAIGFYNNQSQKNSIDQVIKEIDKIELNDNDFKTVETSELGYEEDIESVEGYISETEQLIKDLNIDSDFESFNDITY
jgi:peptidoglycan hydrolase CwlO-like protein